MYFLKNKYVWCCAVMLIFDIQGSDASQSRDGRQSAFSQVPILSRSTIGSSESQVILENNQEAQMGQKTWPELTTESVQGLIVTIIKMEEVNQSVCSLHKKIQQDIADLEKKDTEKTQVIAELCQSNAELRQSNAKLTQKMEELAVKLEHFFALVNQLKQQKNDTK